MLSTVREDRMLVRNSLDNRKLNITQLRQACQTSGIDASNSTDWSWVDWASVLWIDESRFTMFQNNGRVFVRRRQHERFHQYCLAPTVKFCGGGIMTWGSMS